MHAALTALHVHERLRGPNIDYLGVALAAFISWLAFAGPGEAALIAAGLAAAHGHLDIAGAIVAAWAGASVGGTTGWAVGHFAGRRVLTAPGPLAGLRRRMLHSGERLYRRWAPLAVYAAPSWAAGIHHMPARHFVPINAAWAAAWATAVGLGAYFVGPSIADFATDAGIAGISVLVVVVIGGAVLRRRRHRLTSRGRARRR